MPRKHNHAKKFNPTKEYTAWQAMKDRCYNENNVNYHNYGGRGIKVCDRWKNSFENFLEDMGPKPSTKHSLDRQKGDQDYCRENCRWATAKEQGRNTRRNVILEFNGQSMTLPEWAEKINIARGTLYARIFDLKWTVEKALTTDLLDSKENLELGRQRVPVAAA